MKSTLLAIFLLAGLHLPSTYSRQVQFFRKDYTYIEQFDAFYKVHRGVSGSAWSTALFTCDDEGATLFYPKVEGELALVKNLTAKLTNVSEIFIGLHDEVKVGKITTDDGPKGLKRKEVNFNNLRFPEHSTPSSVSLANNLLPQRNQENCMAMNVDTGLVKVCSCLNTPETALAFVCKKVDDETCPTIDQDYKYMKASKKCYKVNDKRVMWEEASNTCLLEGGILAVIEDGTQAEDVRSMLKPEVPYFVGVRRLNNTGELYTVKGQKFRYMYQSQSEQRPEHWEYGTVVYKFSSLYTDQDAGVLPLPFICEMKSAK